MEKIMLQFEDNNSLNQIPGEKIKTVQFKRIIPELIRYIVLGTSSTNMKILGCDYFWLDVTVFVCEKCYLNFTQIFINGHMREEFTKIIPGREKVIKSVPFKKTRRIMNIIKFTGGLSFVQGKVDTGLRKHEGVTNFTLGASTNKPKSPKSG